MTYADVVGQVQQIQAQLALLSPTAAPASTTSGAASFADALTTATGATASTAPTTSTTASTDGTTITANGVTGDDVVTAASRYEGVPYVLGGESTKGIDCSGLVQKTFADLGVSVPRLVHEQQTVGQKVDSLKDAKPGDLIVLNGGDHIAIWAGNGKVIHAPYEGRTVSLQKAWFTDKDVVTIRRVVPSTDEAASASAAAGSTSALSAATVSRATALMSMYGATDGSDASSSSSTLAGLLGDTSGSSTASSSASSSLSSLLSSLGSTTTGGTSTSTAQQLLAARAALLGANA